MPDIKIYDCSDSQLATFEAKLKADGYIFTEKTKEKSLLPMEYLRRTYSGDETSFVGPKRWTIICCKK